MYADVILPLPLAGLFTYALPDDMVRDVKVGCRLVVPFGTRKVYTAIVARVHHDAPAFETKPALELLDPHPVVLESQLWLWHWIADYYLCTIGEVYKAALPSGLKLEGETLVTLSDCFYEEEGLTEREQVILRRLEATPAMTVAALQKETGVKGILSVIKSLFDKGALCVGEELRRGYKPRTIACARITDEYFDGERIQSVQRQLLRSPRQLQLLARYAELSGLLSAIKLQNKELLHEVSKRDLLEGGGFTLSVFNALR
ncbi:MAG: primosomal protein N', partial [Bacteroidaceae bacterium]|nr:primosomal protein N' [Bacteroidaceae bacterium]